MKTAVGLITTTIITAIVATGASAEWRLYVNRDNRAWSLERTYGSNDECDRAARTLYRSGQALGVGCAEYPASTPAPRAAEYSRSNPTSQRQAARADEPARMSAPRSSASRVAEYPGRSTTARPARVAERVADPVSAASSRPAAVIFPPSGGIEIRAEETPHPVAAARPAPRHQAPPVVAQRNAGDDKSSAAVALAKVAAEASTASAREAEAQAAKREAAVTTDKAERRTHVAVFAGAALVIAIGAAYSVYRAARTNPLRALAVCLIELGLLTAALAYPVVELWMRLKVSDSVAPSWWPGLLGGIVVAGVGVIVLALELTRKPAREGTINLGTGALPRDAAIAQRKPQPPVEPLKPVEPARPVEPLTPVETVSKPVEPTTPAEPFKPLNSTWPPRSVQPADAARPVEPAKPVELAKPADAPASVVGGS